MPIQISNYATRPAVAINEVHLVELRINLTEEHASKAKVRLVYKLFGRDSEGNKHFAPEQHVAEIGDAYTAAAQAAGEGDLTLAQALGAIEGAVAAIIAQQGTHGQATVV